jgi:formate dehydrogenase subunit gamma
MASGTRGQAFDAEAAQGVINQHKHLSGAMLPILHALQDEFGHIDPQNVPLIAEALNVSKAEVHGVITFYHDFKTKPQGRHVVKLCLAEACQSMGCEAIRDHVLKKHGVEIGGTTFDGELTIESVYCLGNCALSPAAFIDNELVGRLTAGKLDALIESLGARHDH